MKKLLLLLAFCASTSWVSAGSPQNNMVVSVQDPNTGRQAWVDEFNSTRSSPLTRLVGKPFFSASKDTNFWTESDFNSGTVVQSSGTVVLLSSNTANGGVQYQTNQIARWVTGNENTFRTELRVGDLGTANNVKQWGVYSTYTVASSSVGLNGFCFQSSGTASGLNIVYFSSGTATVIPQSSWNSGALFTLDTNYHLYEIRYTAGDVHFYIDHQLVHTLSTIGNGSVYSYSLHLPVTFSNVNQNSSTTPTTLQVAVGFIMRTGILNTASKYTHIAGAASVQQLSLSPGRLHSVVINTLPSSGSVTLYDTVTSTTSANTIASMVSPTASLPVSVVYDTDIQNGLVVTTTGSTADITVVYE